MDFAAVLSDYARVILEFLLELYVFCILVTLRLGRARFFPLKAAGVVAVAAVAFVAAILYNLFGQTVLGRVLIYIALFAVFFAVGCIDIISIIMRLLSLSFRLFGNNFGGEVLLENMHKMALSLPRVFSWTIPLPFYLLEMLIGLIQAFLFTLLTAVYIGLLTKEQE